MVRERHGHGAVSMVSYRYSSYLHRLRYVGIGLTYLNVLLYTALLVF